MGLKEQGSQFEKKDDQEAARQLPTKVSFRWGRLDTQTRKPDGEMVGAVFELGDVDLGHLLERLIDEDEDASNSFFRTVIAPMRKQFGTPEMSAKIRLPGRHEDQLQRFLGEDPSILSQVVDDLDKYQLLHEELSESKKEFIAGVTGKIRSVIEDPKESDDLSKR